MAIYENKFEKNQVDIFTLNSGEIAIKNLLINKRKENLASPKYGEALVLETKILDVPVYNKTFLAIYCYDAIDEYVAKTIEERIKNRLYLEVQKFELEYLAEQEATIELIHGNINYEDINKFLKLVYNRKFSTNAIMRNFDDKTNVTGILYTDKEIRKNMEEWFILEKILENYLLQVDFEKERKIKSLLK